ncbi:MAG: dTDP-4-dehydrorhamnose 3,5-epimerase-like enzyme [Verrucomicrobiales bacterium]|jgi:dTDP-4-dehydrorhamnose 3,5-epimerase-like enzyme
MGNTDDASSSNQESDHTRRWGGLSPGAQEALELRDYSSTSLAEQLATSGLEIGRLVTAREELAAAGAWIPGVEVLPRTIYQQPHRGFFGEFARHGEGTVGELGFWPRQWATARMFAGTAKGFHIHPPAIPEGVDPAAWFQKLFVELPDNVALRPYDREQWDMMFFVQGMVEMLLVDERAGMPRRVMRFIIFGDDLPGPNNAGIVIPAGVAHALHCASTTDCIMVYGTSTVFDPLAEGRIASGVETKHLPADWKAYLD